MSDFRKYDHVERLGHDDVEGILDGTVYVYPKLDGTNGSVWLGEDGETIKCASRNHVLGGGRDNAGFYAWVHSDAPEAVALRNYVKAHPYHIVYGEWLVPHTLKTYREEMWRRFWVFDLYDRVNHQYMNHIHFIGSNIDVVWPLRVINNPSEDQLQAAVDSNTFLIQDGLGVGEGVVIKNYAWKNKYGRQPWAKIVRNEFKESHVKAMGVPELDGPFNVELAIAEEFVTPTLVAKTHAKILVDLLNELGESAPVLSTAEDLKSFTMTNRGRIIPQLLGRVWHDLITEEMWAILKKYQKSHPTINFKKLQGRVTTRIKEIAKDLF